MPRDVSRHPYVSSDNMAVIIGLIETEVESLTGEKVCLDGQEWLVDTVVNTALEYSDNLWTPDVAGGTAVLNDIVMRRAVRRLTAPDTAGQYYPNNALYGQRDTSTRRGRSAYADPVRGPMARVVGSAFDAANHHAIIAQQRSLLSGYTRGTAERFASMKIKLDHTHAFRRGNLTAPA